MDRKLNLFILLLLGAFTLSTNVFASGCAGKGADDCNALTPSCSWDGFNCNDLSSTTSKVGVGAASITTTTTTTTTVSLPNIAGAAVGSSAINSVPNTPTTKPCGSLSHDDCKTDSLCEWNYSTGGCLTVDDYNAFIKDPTNFKLNEDAEDAYNKLHPSTNLGEHNPTVKTKTPVTIDKYCGDYNNDPTACSSAVFYAGNAKPPVTTDENITSLYEIYKKRYDDCVTRHKDKVKTLDLDKVCSYPKCTWVTGTSGNHLCVSSLPNPYPYAVMNDANPSWTGVLNAKMQTISETELYNKFDTELKNGDFFLKDYSGYLNATTNEFDKGTYQHNSTKTEVNCQDLMLDPWIVEIMSNQRTKNSKCTVPLVYITLKGKTAPEADQVYFLYNETYLGFIPLEKDENTYSKVVYKSKGGYDFVQDSKKILAIPRYANFCKEVVEHSFKVNAETLAAWSLIDDTTDLLSKGNLKFKNGQTFPYSVDQLRAIRAYCPDIDKTINDFVRQEDADFDNDKPQKTVGCKVLKGMKNDIKKGVTSVDIPPAYASRLSDSMKYDLSDVCSGSSAKLKLKGAIRDIDNLLFSSSLAGHKKSDYSTSYRLNLDAINEVSNDIVSNTASDNEDKDKDNSTKTRKKCKSNDATWGKRLLCAAGSAEGITAITTAALGGFTLYWNVKQWKAELAFQKEQFEDGQCAPYKGDVSNTLNLNLGGSTTTPMSMYAFCKLAASGALAFMNPCTALSAEGAPAQAISRCYGIYTNMNSGMVNYGNLPPTAAATTSAATGATGTTAATGAKDAGTSAAAAAPSSAGTNAGAAASPTDKKSKSFDSLYPSPYYPQTAVKSTAAYPYQYEPQGTTAPSTAAANKVAAKTSTVRGATIGEQVAGHMRTIQSTILSK